MLRSAFVSDIPELTIIRNSVKENALNNPALVTQADYVKFLTTEGRGWLTEKDGVITGFSILDTARHNVWALFVRPGEEGKGYGKLLLDELVNFHFQTSSEQLWLTTGPGTRAESVYRAAGWRDEGLVNGEVKFVLQKK